MSRKSEKLRLASFLRNSASLPSVIDVPGGSPDTGASKRLPTKQLLVPMYRRRASGLACAQAAFYSVRLLQKAQGLSNRRLCQSLFQGGDAQAKRSLNEEFQ